MKIGILTVPFNNNYGGLLQAYALKAILCDMGHNVVFINRQRNKPRSLKFRIYSMLVKLHIIEDYLKKRSKELSENTDKFIQQKLSPMTKAYYSTQEFCQVKNLGIDYYIVGSDQVWRYYYAEDSIDDFFFNILDGDRTPRMSYAASFGTDNMEYPKKKQMIATRLLKQFKGLSVREESGRDLLHNYFDVPLDAIDVVLDPTFLLDVDKYKMLFGNEQRNHTDYAFTYILDSKFVNQYEVQLLCERMNLSRIDMKAQTGDLSKLNVIAPVEQWLYYLYYSNVVITDSFHGTVFSIIFNKQFVVVTNPERGIARLQSLLSNFGLEDRLVNTIDESTLDILNKTVNWKRVNTIIKEKKNASMHYLIRMLNN